MSANKLLCPVALCNVDIARAMPTLYTIRTLSVTYLRIPVKKKKEMPLNIAEGASGLRLEWSGKAERGSAPRRAALVARCNNDDGDEARDDGDGRSGDEEDGGNNDEDEDDDDDNDDDGDGGSGGGDGEPAGDARDGIRRVRALGTTGETCLSLNCTRLHPGSAAARLLL
ncbi:hypothetical protein DBV15_03995 [Temnothorax longispinosus]|uniref:Uncharacterized protein n=1 Tax=Temnothorax longispinosus TaxID=300112 RepID=A0A4S2L405_9HYME|nr:hypothetical protein DBV15_03995 [Temnothorax longispinosus]